MLLKKYNSKIKRDLIDMDYIDKLNDDEKDFLNRFLEETVNANFKHEGERILPKKFKSKVVKKTGKRKRVDILKQECEYDNNHRNTCIFNIANAVGTLEGIDKIETNSGNSEDFLIELIDKKIKLTG